jgi:putative ABC transport system permease protein
MRIWEACTLAFKNIRTSKTRTILTMLGIIIGVMAVIVIVGLGNGLSNYITESFASLGTNTIQVSVYGRGMSTRSVSVDDMYQIVDDNPEYLDLMTPSVSVAGTIKVGSETLDYTSATGISEDYFSIYQNEVAKGRSLTYADIKERKRVCVVGAYIDETYYNGNAVGQTIKVDGADMTIIGVLKQEGDELEEGGQDDILFLPYTTASRLSMTMINGYIVTMKDESMAKQSVEVIENALQEVYQDSYSYSVVSMSEMLDSMTSMINVVVGVLAGIAAISLLVGGIGIMNIMLVSVTERTREIGIRKALGAKERYILQQFVIEAAFTSALGGVIGIVLGYLMSAAASQVVAALMEDSFTVAPGIGAVLVAFGISAGIGVLFGYLPAKKAARLNPIDALHFD